LRLFFSIIPPPAVSNTFGSSVDIFRELPFLVFCVVDSVNLILWFLGFLLDSCRRTWSARLTSTCGVFVLFPSMFLSLFGALPFSGLSATILGLRTFVFYVFCCPRFQIGIPSTDLPPPARYRPPAYSSWPASL